MNKEKIYDNTLALLTVLTIIIFAILFTVFFKPLFYFDIHNLKIDKAVNLTISQIKNNYDALIRYQSLFYTKDLILPNFKMSLTGKVHFQEVKYIFNFLQIILIITGIITIKATLKKFRENDFLFFKRVSLLTLLIPLIIAIIASMNFTKSFELFHRILFKNNYWIFDPLLDPVILILPEQFFMHCFILIIIIIITFSLIFYFISNRLMKKMLNKT